jgi:hypothetical protein
MDTLSQLQSQFLSEPEKKQLQLIPQLVALGEPGLEVLIDYLRNHSSEVNIVVGKAYQALYQAKIPKTKEFLEAKFPLGVVALKSERQVDYQPLQQLLIEQEYLAADKLTLEKLCELAGENALKRKWLYFTEVEQFPFADLQTLDQLWQIYSEGKFGFSVQRKIWLSVGKDLNKIWPKIGWRSQNGWTRYPSGFIWDLSAPVGHLPSSNQLRGSRVIAALFSHPVWE